MKIILLALLSTTACVLVSAFCPQHPTAMYVRPAARASLVPRDMADAQELVPVTLFLLGVAGTFAFSGDNEIMSKQIQSSVNSSKAAVEEVAMEEVSVTKDEEVVELTPVSTKLTGDISKIRKEVSSTIEGEMEKEARIREAELRRAEELLKMAEEADKEKEEQAVETGDIDTTKEEEEVVVERGPARKGFRVLKKVVAPWRKWKNIS